MFLTIRRRSKVKVNIYFSEGFMYSFLCFIIFFNHRVKEICSSYMDLLHSQKMRPLVVFDGLSLPGKDREREERAR